MYLIPRCILLMLLGNFNWALAFSFEPNTKAQYASTYPPQNHVLTCEFRNSMECTECRKDILVEIAARREFIKSNGRNTAWCSLNETVFPILAKMSFRILQHQDLAAVSKGEPLVGRSLRLRIPEDVPCNASLVCFDRISDPTLSFHRELDGTPSTITMDNGSYAIKLFLSGHVLQAADFSNLTCVVIHGSNTSSARIFVKLQKHYEWNIPAIRITSVAVGACFLVSTVLACCVFLLECSKRLCTTSSPPIRSCSIDNWTKNVCKKASLPEPPIINYDPEDLELLKCSLRKDLD